MHKKGQDEQMESVEKQTVFSYITEQPAFFYPLAYAENAEGHGDSAEKIQWQKAVVRFIHIHISQAGSYF